MPTLDRFNELPPFPNNVPIADLRCLSFNKLLADETSESEQLFESCREIGFFLVDLKGSSEGENMLKHAETAFDLNKQILELDQEELTKHAFKPPASLFGYVLEHFSGRLQQLHLPYIMNYASKLINSNTATNPPAT